MTREFDNIIELMEIENFQDALVILNNLIERNCNNPELFSLRAICHAHLNNFILAEWDIRKCLETDEDGCPNAVFAIASIYKINSDKSLLKIYYDFKNDRGYNNVQSIDGINQDIRLKEDTKLSDLIKKNQDDVVKTNVISKDNKYDKIDTQLKKYLFCDLIYRIGVKNIVLQDNDKLFPIEYYLEYYSEEINSIMQSVKYEKSDSPESSNIEDSKIPESFVFKCRKFLNKFFYRFFH